MNAFIVTAVVCFVWLAAGLLVARCVSFRGLHMIDLLENKLEALDDSVAVGLITDDARAVIVANLIKHAATISVMHQLLAAAPFRAVAHAELIDTDGMPELRIYIRPGHLHALRETLTAHGFAELGLGDKGLEFDGDYRVRIAYQPKHMIGRMAGGLAA